MTHDEGNTMREQLEARLAELTEEIAIGEQRWREVDAEQARLRETLLRMSGAIQVITELLEGEGTSDGEVDGARAGTSGAGTGTSGAPAQEAAATNGVAAG